MKFTKISDTEVEMTETITNQTVNKVVLCIPDIQKRKAELETELQNLNDILTGIDSASENNTTNIP